jgi:hypothetical protein
MHMSDQAQGNNQQIMMIGLGVIAVLLAVIVGILIYQGNQAQAPAPAQAPAAQQPVAGAAAGQGAMGGVTGGATGGTTGGDAGAPAAVDPGAATKVPKDMEPADYVKAYYVACEKGDWKAAYDSLPADKKAGQTPEGLQQQVEGYQVQSFSVGDAAIQGDNATVKADQVTGSYGTFENTWTFVKKDGQWYVASKAVTGMK